MKKLAIVAVAMTLITGMAFASSMAIPWFVDNAAPPSTIPPAAGVVTIIYLKNNTTEDISARIAYFTASGIAMGPVAAEAGGPGNSFTIGALASIGARPVADDVNQEAEGAGRAMPNRPRTGEGQTARANGSATISWVGGSTDLQGQLSSWAANLAFAHLLPPGAE